MSVPTHAPHCETRLWATTCPDCGARVFFFSCTCGSKVFFDLPTPPWPLHQDRCLPYMIRVLRDVHKHSTTSIRRLVEDHAHANGLSIPGPIHRQLLADENRESGKVTIVDLLPGSSETSLAGSIVAVNRSVNFLKRLGYPDGPMARGILGDLASEPYVEVTVREERDPKTGFCSQITCYYPAAKFRAGGLTHGRKVFAYVDARTLPSGDEVWIASELYPR